MVQKALQVLHLSVYVGYLVFQESHHITKTFHLYVLVHEGLAFGMGGALGRRSVCLADWGVRSLSGTTFALQNFSWL